MKRTVVFLLVCSFLLTLSGCGLVKREKEVVMMVLIDESLTDAEARSVGTRLMQLPEVTDVTFISREKVFENFLESHENSEAFAGVTAADLRHRYEVSVTTADTEGVARRIKDIEGVARVSYSKDVSAYDFAG